MSPLPQACVAVVTGGPEAEQQRHDLVCTFCGGDGRLHPVEPCVEQVRIFLGQHRHECDPDAGW